jgi:uncharacterized membrane protein
MNKPTPNYIRIAIALTVTNLLILGLRNVAVGDSTFNFLLSNLFIGSLPVLVIAFLIERYEARLRTVFFWVATGAWVLFYPNAPYMISDLIHNSQEPLDKSIKTLLVYDTLIIFSIAMLSVFYGLVSLKVMFGVFKKRYGRKFAHIAIFGTVALSCLGFYMGRELLSSIPLGNGYLYSWEIILEPVQIVKTVWAALWPIGEHLPAYAMMGLFGAAQYMLLIMFKDVNDIEGAGLVTKD